jgi:hypothetical protein
MKYRDRTYYDCVCGCSIIRLTLWHDSLTEVDFSILRYANWGRPGWGQRLRHIWEIIRTGTPWADEVILEIDEVKILKKELTRLINKSQSLSKK